MNRRDFGKIALTATAATIVSPQILAWPVESEEPKNSEWCIYEKPRDGFDYSIGVSTSQDSDVVCISVMRIGNANEVDSQVAEFILRKVTEDRAAFLISKIAGLYNDVCLEKRGPLLAIEQRSNLGYVMQRKLKLMGFKRFLVTIQYTSSSGRNYEKCGWYSNSWSAPILIDRFAYALRKAWYAPMSPQLRKYSDTLIFAYPETRRDPVFMSAAQSYFAAHSGQLITQV